MSEWISVSSELPAMTTTNKYYMSSGSVVVFCPKYKKTKVYVGRLIGYANESSGFHFHWLVRGHHSKDAVTHWMPLPQFPEEE